MPPTRKPGRPTTRQRPPQTIEHEPPGLQATGPSRRNTRRTPVRQRQVREPLREPLRTSSGGVQVIGRDGEILTRRRTTIGDIFHISPDLIPEGWDYQWIAESVTGNTDIVQDQNLMMLENGWRPVHCERHPGMFMPRGHKGPIRRGGQGLYERPLELTKEAKLEELRAAKGLISDSRESYTRGKKQIANKMMDVQHTLAPGAGIEMSEQYRGTGGKIRLQIDPGLDIPAPQHELANPGD